MFTSAGSVPAAQAASLSLSPHSGTTKRKMESQRKRLMYKETKTGQMQEVNKLTERNTSARKGQMETKGSGSLKTRSSYRKVWCFSRWPLVCRSWGRRWQRLRRPHLHGLSPASGHVQPLAPRQHPTPLCGGRSGRSGTAFHLRPTIHL